MNYESKKIPIFDKVVYNLILLSARLGTTGTILTYGKGLLGRLYGTQLRNSLFYF